MKSAKHYSKGMFQKHFHTYYLININSQLSWLQG